MKPRTGRAAMKGLAWLALAGLLAAPAPAWAQTDAGTPAPAHVLTGTVLETLAGGGYTYARVSVDGEKELWVAGPETGLEIGRRVELAGAVSMGSFTSSSLGRTFEELYFVGAFVPADPPPGGERGVAVEVLSSGGYTYVQAQVGEETVWLAVPETRVEPGDTVVWLGGMQMGEFRSPTLERTFDAILFTERIWVAR